MTLALGTIVIITLISGDNAVVSITDESTNEESTSNFDFAFNKKSAVEEETIQFTEF